MTSADPLRPAPVKTGGQPRMAQGNCEARQPGSTQASTGLSARVAELAAELQAASDALIASWRATEPEPAQLELALPGGSST